MVAFGVFSIQNYISGPLVLGSGRVVLNIFRPLHSSWTDHPLSWDLWTWDLCLLLGNMAPDTSQDIPESNSQICLLPEENGISC